MAEPEGDESGSTRVIPDSHEPCPGCGRIVVKARKNKYCRMCRTDGLKKGPLVPGPPVGEFATLRDQIRIRKERGDPDAVMLMQLADVWLDGKFPNGTRVESETTRKDAMTKLLSRLGGEKGTEDLEVKFVLDATIRCAECGKKMAADPRVDADDLKGAV